MNGKTRVYNLQEQESETENSIKIVNRLLIYDM